MKKLLLVIILLAICNTSFGANKVVVLDLDKVIKAYQKSKFYHDDIDIHFGGDEQPEYREAKDLQRSATLRTSKRKAVKVNNNDYIQKDAEREEIKHRKPICYKLAAQLLGKMARHAKSVNANAIIDVHSNFKGYRAKSHGDIECHLGSFLPGISLSADYVVK